MCFRYHSYWRDRWDCRRGCCCIDKGNNPTIFQPHPLSRVESLINPFSISIYNIVLVNMLYESRTHTHALDSQHRKFSQLASLLPSLSVVCIWVATDYLTNQTGKWNWEAYCCFYCWTNCSFWPSYGSCWRYMIHYSLSFSHCLWLSLVSYHSHSMIITHVIGGICLCSYCVRGEGYSTRQNQDP